MNSENRILDNKAILQKVNRLAWQIFENNIHEKQIVIVGIAGRGEILASALSEVIKKISSINVILGKVSLDKENPHKSQVTTDLEQQDYSGEVVILVDDVLNSGKTLIYAAKHFLTTPLNRLSTVVLVNRTHNRFPIKADYVGLSLATTLNEYITVVLEGNRKGVYLT